MRIEDEIKQKQFSSEYQKLTVNILFTGSWMEREHHRLLKDFDISLQQYNILRILRGQHPNPASINLLTERMLDRMSNASRLVEKLRTKNLVARKQCPNDRRQVDVLITDQGLKLLSTLDKKIKELEDGFKSITDAEAKELNRILDKLRGKG